MLVWQTLDDGRVGARIVSRNHGDMFSIMIDEDDEGYFFEVKDPDGALLKREDGFEDMVKVRDAAEDHANRRAMKAINRR